jgi:hypothetical protein
MFIAAWKFDMKWGTRDETMRLMKEFESTEQKGWKSTSTRVLVGSIGAPESRVVVEHSFESLADLEASWEALHKNADFFTRWVSQARNVILDGSPRWEIYRVVVDR